MTWLKTMGSAMAAALLAFLAIFAVANARKQKQIGEKWQEKAVDIEAGKVTSATVTAEAASTKAKLHEAKANELKKKAEARISGIAKDEDVADIVDRWRK